MPRWPRALIVPLLLQGVAHAQPSPIPQTPTLRAKTNLVILDVVVTDHGQPVHNLTASDFAIAEDKTAQAIKSFDEHAPAPPPPVEVLPPGVFSNRVLNPTRGPMNILLIDLLNTPPLAVKRLNLQVLAYLKHMKPGTQLAIFALDSQLRYMQGFTSDPALLQAAVQASIDHFQTDEFPVQRMLSTPCQNQQRPFYTREAMSDMAKYLAAVPGRKNLIWFSARFPFSSYVDTITVPRENFTMPVNPYDPPGEPGPCDGAYNSSKASAEYNETTKALRSAQIAVYLADMRGLDSADQRPDGSEKGLQVKADEDATMQELAHDTGGDFTTNNNDLSGFIAKSIDDGSSYYTLTYDPTNKSADGKYRKIQVALAQKGYELNYRRGYYAEDSKAEARLAATNPSVPATSAAQKAVDTAMRHGLPGPTEILLKTFVGPGRGPDQPAATEGTPNPKVTGPFHNYRVTFAASPAELTFTRLAEGQYQLQLEFVVFCYDANGALINSVDKIAKTPVTRDDAALMLKTGYTFRETISVPIKGDYFLRIGVHDLPSNKMGVLEIPIAAVRDLPPDPRP